MNTEDVVIPNGLADRWELLTKESAKILKNKRDKILTSIGSRPYKGLPVDETELRGRWMQIRKDPNELLNVLAENAKFKNDGRVLLPKKLISKITDYESKLKEGGFV
jgi:hypothetical protein